VVAAAPNARSSCALTAVSDRAFSNRAGVLNAQSWPLIIVWLEVRVLPAPPRSLAQTEISRLVLNSPRTSGDSCTRFVSASCRLDIRDRFGSFVSAHQNSVSPRRRPVLVETGFETGSVRGKTEHFALPGPFRWQVGEASEAHAARERPSMAALRCPRSQPQRPADRLGRRPSWTNRVRSPTCRSGRHADRLGGGNAEDPRHCRLSPPHRSERLAPCALSGDEELAFYGMPRNGSRHSPKSASDNPAHSRR
jgi:hypothetical protein